MKKLELSSELIVWLISAYAFFCVFVYAMLKNNLSVIQIFGLSTILYIVILVVSYVMTVRSMKKDKDKQEDKSNE